MKYIISLLIFSCFVWMVFCDEDDHVTKEEDFSDFGPQHKHRNDPVRWREFYLGRIFDFYGINPTKGESMGETVLAQLMFNLSLLVTHEIVEVEESGHDEHGEEDDHDRKKREVTSNDEDHDHEPPISLDKKISDSTSNIPHGHSVDNSSNCLDAEALLDQYNLHSRVTKDRGIGTYELGLLCPAFIDNILRKSCVKEIHRDHVHLLHIKHPHGVNGDHVHRFHKERKNNKRMRHDDGRIDQSHSEEMHLDSRHERVETQGDITLDNDHDEHDRNFDSPDIQLDGHHEGHRGVGGLEERFRDERYQEEYCICGTIHIHEKKSPPAGQVWGWGILSITIISLLSFLGAALIPIIAANFFETLLSILVSSAVGALAGDALLHLLPHSQGGGHEHSNRGVYSNLTGLGGIYLLFVIEGIMKIMHAQKDKNKHKSKFEMKNGARPPTTMSKKELEVDFDPKSDDDIERSSIDKRSESEEHHSHEEQPHGHGHGHNHDHGDMTEKTIASVAWMVIAGDGMHNFSDGVAIGAAFSQSIVGGLSTSVAVFCHELPHELGDFAMLLKAGMSVKQALFYNAVAACLGYLGLVVGILIGKYASDVTPWIFALTAGMFLYVGLVDMLPEISPTNGGGSLIQMLFRFLLQNFGLLIGITIMLLIALFEDNIDFS